MTRLFELFEQLIRTNRLMTDPIAWWLPGPHAIRPALCGVANKSAIGFLTTSINYRCELQHTWTMGPCYDWPRSPGRRYSSELVASSIHTGKPPAANHGCLCFGFALFRCIVNNSTCRRCSCSMSLMLQVIDQSISERKQF